MHQAAYPLYIVRRSGISAVAAGVLVVVFVVAAGAGFYLYGSSQSGVTTTTATVTQVSTVTPAGAIVPLRVFAAASFTQALEALQSSYQQNNSVSLIYNFASSGALETQIAQGSPADVFLDADVAKNAKLQNLSLLGNGDTYVTLIYNSIALFVPANNPKNILSLSDLLKPGVRVAICDPASCPAGAYTVQVWANIQSKWGNSSSPDFESAVYSNFANAISSHIVTQATDVESAITQVLTGAADAAFGYVSDGIANAAQLHQISISSDVNAKAVYTASVIKSSKYPTQANGFIAYLLSVQGQEFLKKWGFTTLSGS